MPPPQKAADNRSAQTRGMEMANSAMSMALGGQQKAWMTGKPFEKNLKANSAVLSNNGNKVLDRPSQVDATVKARVGSNAGGGTGDKNDSAMHRTSSERVMGSPIQPVPTVRPSTAIDCPWPSEDGHRAPVLSSPALSDELRQDSNQVIEIYDESDGDSESLIEPNLNRPAELPEICRGVGALERCLQTPGASNDSGSQTNSKLRHSDSERYSADTQRKRRSEAEHLDRRRAAATLPASLGSNPHRSEAIIESQVTSSTPVDVSSFKRHMQVFLEQVLSRSQTVGSLSGRGNVEGPRLRLLYEACHHGDLFFLITHQLYCVHDSGGTSSANREFELSPQHLQGLSVLRDLLVQNAQLPDDAIKFFSDFPRPLPLLVELAIHFKQAFYEVLAYLNTLSSTWHSLKVKCFERQYPPVIDEMGGLTSLVLQKVMFRAISRELWNGCHDQCFQECEKIFYRNQENFGWRLTHQTASFNAERYNQSLAQDYVRLREQHALHTAPNIVHHHRSSSRNHSNSPMAPPQNNHVRRPSSGNMSHQSLINQQEQAINIARFTHTPTINTQSSRRHPSLTLNSVVTPVSTPTLPSSVTPPATSPASVVTPSDAHPGSGIYSVNSTSTAPNQQQRVSGSPSAYTTQFVQVPFASSSPTIPTTPGSAQIRNFNHQQQQISPRIGWPGSSPSQILRSPTMMSSFPTRGQIPQALFPQPGAAFTPNPTNHLDPTFSALHQAHLRSPRLVTVGHEGKSDNSKKYFRYIKGFVPSPKRLDEATQHFIWSFQVSAEAAQVLASSITYLHGPTPTRHVRTGSRLCRLRCANVSRLPCPLKDAEWVTAETVWPEGIAVLLNQNALEIRRKVHHGKDLPIDVTSIMREGENTISVARIGSRKDSGAIYAIGLETVQITDLRTIKKEVGQLGKEEALHRILEKSSSVDPDIEVIDSRMVLDLTDPFTSSIFETPIRAISCLHNQCFDLDVFLSTRKQEQSSEPCGPDQFKCPICGGDARPQSLVIDQFFVHIRERLAQIDRLDAKAIILEKNGTWEIKEEEEVAGESGDGSGVRRRKPDDSPAASAGRRRESVIIELDDD